MGDAKSVPLSFCKRNKYRSQRRSLVETLLAVVCQDVVPIKTRGFGVLLRPSRAKDGAISPRLGNRYTRFPLSHRSCCDGFRGKVQREQRPEISQLATSSIFHNLSERRRSKLCLYEGFVFWFGARKTRVSVAGQRFL